MNKVIQCKASMHVGKKYSTKHNLRTLDKDRSNLDGHIDYSREHLNVVLENKSLRTLFDETFGDAIIEFNQKNWIKHPERVIGYSKKEYDKLVVSMGQEKADILVRGKAVGAYLEQQKKQVQEVIIQLGDHANYLELLEQLGQEKTDILYKDLLINAFEEWKNRNPSMKIFCATVHMDEIRDGTPHLHIDFLPTSESNRGLKTKVSVDGALKECGYARDKKKDTTTDRPYTNWLRDNRKAIENCFKMRSESFLKPFKENISIDILPSEETPAGHKRKTTAQWKEEQAIENLEKVKQETKLEEQRKVLIASMTIPNRPVIDENESFLVQMKQKKAVTEWDKKYETLYAAQEIIRQRDNLLLKAKLDADKLKKDAETYSEKIKNDAIEKEKKAQELLNQAESKAKHAEELEKIAKEHLGYKLSNRIDEEIQQVRLEPLFSEIYEIQQNTLINSAYESRVNEQMKEIIRKQQEEIQRQIEKNEDDLGGMTR